MSVLYALLVGIDRYHRVAAPLAGARNDVLAAEEFLRHRMDAHTTVLIERLCDEQATRAAVIAGFRSHLGRARAGDTALFWFSGHGSAAPVPPALWPLEPTGRLQTLLCVDSRHGTVPDLFDKEIAVLIDEVAARGGHVALVLDACHAGGANRAPVRAAAPLSGLPPLELLLPEMVTRVLGGGVLGGTVSGGTEVRLYAGTADHVALAACRADEQAGEIWHEGRQHGAFTAALLTAARRLGPGASYRELLTSARCEVENLVPRQVPQLYPAGGSLADRAFLGGRVRSVGAAMTMRFQRGSWEIDAGACHGLPTGGSGGSGGSGGELRVAERGAGPGREVREAEVVEVLTTHSTVRPLGWRPDPHRQYPIVLSSVPLPSTTVDIGGAPDDDPEIVARLVAAVCTAGPLGGPSVQLRLAGADRADLRVAAAGPGAIRILDGAGTPLTGAIEDPDGDPVRRTVQLLEHIARWRRVRSLANPLSGLAGAVTVELVPVRPGDIVVPLHRPGLRAGDDGAVRLRYRSVTGRWVAPAVFVRLHNNTDRPLYCALLDLTERFRVYDGLFPGATIAGGGSAATGDGRPTQFSLPSDQPPRPGLVTRDWLKLLVAEREFSVRPFTMGALGERPGGLGNLGERPGGAARTQVGLRGVLDRLGVRVSDRDARPGVAAAYDWTASTLPVLTEVPGHH